MKFISGYKILEDDLNDNILNMGVRVKQIVPGAVTDEDFMIASENNQRGVRKESTSQDNAQSSTNGHCIQADSSQLPLHVSTKHSGYNRHVVIIRN